MPTAFSSACLIVTYSTPFLVTASPLALTISKIGSTGNKVKVRLIYLSIIEFTPLILQVNSSKVCEYKWNK